MVEIELKNLTKKYKNFIAVDDISLNIEKGELFSLLGVNGAGKTTTIKMISTLIKQTSGEILIEGSKIEDNITYIKSIINLSPQETAIAPNLTVYENLKFMSGVYGIKDDKKIEDLIKLFKLDTVINKKAKALSGGFKRRLSIAISLINDPKILFLDEPTLGLDVIARRELWNIIKNLKGNTTIILTTHYMDEAYNLSDRVGIMKDGKILDVDTPFNIVKKSNSNNFEDAFIKIVGDTI